MGNLRYYGRLYDFREQVLMRFVSVLSMASTFVTYFICYDMQQPHYIFACLFTLVTSAMYHSLESFYIDKTVYIIQEHEWHIMDNVGVIAMFTCAF